MHTGDNLGKVPWRADVNNELEPGSFCDKQYFEDTFNGDETFFYKSIGTVNVAEVTQKLIISPREIILRLLNLKEV